MFNPKKISKLVKTILEIFPECRDSDNMLYLFVMHRFSLELGVDIKEMPVSVFLVESRKLGFPPFESVRRARQKLQRKFPELRACEAVQGMRAENEEAYREYARS